MNKPHKYLVFLKNFEKPIILMDSSPNKESLTTIEKHITEILKKNEVYSFNTGNDLLVIRTCDISAILIQNTEEYKTVKIDKDIAIEKEDEKLSVSEENLAIEKEEVKLSVSEENLDSFLDNVVKADESKKASALENMQESLEEEFDTNDQDYVDLSSYDLPLSSEEVEKRIKK